MPVVSASATPSTSTLRTLPAASGLRPIASAAFPAAMPWPMPCPTPGDHGDAGAQQCHAADKKLIEFHRLPSFIFILCGMQEEYRQRKEDICLDQPREHIEIQMQKRGECKCGRAQRQKGADARIDGAAR